LIEVLRDEMCHLRTQPVEACAVAWSDRHVEILKDVDRYQVVYSMRCPQCALLSGAEPVEMAQVRVPAPQLTQQPVCSNVIPTLCLIQDRFVS
jgi:hypothetical protein